MALFSGVNISSFDIFTFLTFRLAAPWWAGGPKTTSAWDARCQTAVSGRLESFGVFVGKRGDGERSGSSAAQREVMRPRLVPHRASSARGVAPILDRSSRTGGPLQGG